MAQLKGRVTTRLTWTLPPALPGGSKAFPGLEWLSHSSMSWVFLGVSFWRGMLRTHLRKEPRVHPRCPSHLSWLLLMWRSSSSTPSSSQVTELLTLSLREHPAASQRKPILAACIQDLILLVTTQSSYRGECKEFPQDTHIKKTSVNGASVCCFQTVVKQSNDFRAESCLVGLWGWTSRRWKKGWHFLWCRNKIFVECSYLPQKCWVYQGETAAAGISWGSQCWKQV